jgi:hypothetical protein
MEPMKPMKPLQPMEPMEPMKETEAWWPKELGTPSASGSADALRYAYFPDGHRLAVDDGRAVAVYDTGAKRIGGFHAKGGTLGFDTDDGPGTLDALKTV